MRRPSDSLAADDRCPLTGYVSQQLGHADASITLRAYAHYLPGGAVREVYRLDAPAEHPDAIEAHPKASATDRDVEATALMEW